MRPRRLVHTGTVLARGLAIDAALLGEDEARRRVIASWKNGTTVTRVGSVFLVRWPEPGGRRVVVAQAAGAPLVPIRSTTDDAVAAAPLTAKELAPLDVPRGAVVLVQAAAVEVIDASKLAPVDPAAWIDLGAYERVATETMAAPAAPPRVVAEVIEGPLRDRFGDAVAPAAPELAEVVRALKAAAPRGAGTAAGKIRATEVAAASPGFFAEVAETARQLFRALGDLLSFSTGEGGAGGIL